MGVTMRWQNYSDQYETIREAESIVDEVVTDYRNRGHRTPYAIKQAAQALGTSAWKAKALFYGEAGAICLDMLREMRLRFEAHLDAEAAHALERAAAKTARREQMEKSSRELAEMRRSCR